MSVVLQFLLSIAIPLFAASSMASVGVGHELREVTLPLRRPAMLLTAILANFVAVPLLGVLLLRVFALALPHAAGLFLVASAAGAAFLLALSRLARADSALAGGLLLILLPCPVLYMPIVVPMAFPEAHVPVWAVARPLVLTMLLPLALGVAFRWRFRAQVPRVMPFLTKTSMGSLMVLLTATVLANLPAIAALWGTPAVPAAGLLVLGALLIGFLGSVPSRGARIILALGTGQRNIAAAMIVATSFDSPGPLVMVVVTSLVGFAVLFPAAWLFRRMLERRETKQVRFGTPKRTFLDRRRRT